MKEQTAYVREWPSDEAMADALVSSPLYRLLTRGRLRLVLEGVENRLRSSGRSEQTSVPRNLTIEHLMPTGWEQTKWPLPKNVDTVAATYQRNTLIPLNWQSHARNPEAQLIHVQRPLAIQT